MLEKNNHFSVQTIPALQKPNLELNKNNFTKSSFNACKQTINAQSTPISSLHMGLRPHHQNGFVQSAGAVEYTDCTSAEG